MSDSSTDHDQHQVTLRWLNARLIIVVIATSFVTALVVGGVVALVVQQQANAAFREASVSNCDGSNLLRGFARLATNRGVPTRPNDSNLGDWLLRIRDCETSYDEGRVVVISSSNEVMYLTALAAHRRVAVRDGGKKLVAIP